MLSPFGVQFTVTSGLLPGVADYTEVAVLTDQFVIDFFEVVFSQIAASTLERFVTIFVSGNFIFNRPIQVDFEAIAFFDPESPELPTQEQLDEILGQAFQGGNLDLYLMELGRLTSPVFSTTTMAALSNSTSAPLSADERASAMDVAFRSRRHNEEGFDRAVLTGVVSLSSGGLMAILAFFYVWRRRKQTTAPLVKALPGDVSNGAATSIDDSSRWTAEDSTLDGRPTRDLYIQGQEHSQSELREEQPLQQQQQQQQQRRNTSDSVKFSAPAPVFHEIEL